MLGTKSPLKGPTPASWREGLFDSGGLNSKPMSANRTSHIRLTSHPGAGAASRFPIHWDAPTARERGPVIASPHAGADRNAIGAHGGAYSVYRALAVSAGALNPLVRPELANTHPVVE